jgi:hypothetical protein
MVRSGKTGTEKDSALFDASRYQQTRPKGFEPLAPGSEGQGLACRSLLRKVLTLSTLCIEFETLNVRSALSIFY